MRRAFRAWLWLCFMCHSPEANALTAVQHAKIGPFHASAALFLFSWRSYHHHTQRRASPLLINAYALYFPHEGSGLVIICAVVLRRFPARRNAVMGKKSNTRAAV